MELLNYLAPQDLLIGLHAADKWEAIELLLDHAAECRAMQSQTGIDFAHVREAVHRRESEKATGLAGGFALPHARIPGLRGAVLSLAVLDTPVDFGAADGVPARCVCLILVPENQPTAVLKVMAQFARMASDPSTRDALMNERRRDELYHFLRARLVGTDKAVTAADIMRQPFAEIGPDTPLREVTRTMLRHNLDAISVVAKDGALLGEITCEKLFQLGMPDFFSQLKTIGFIAEFDPFEKYFAAERNTRAVDVMSTSFASVPEDATIMEVVFELAIRRHSKVYVLRDGKRIGIIDRMLVLDRVINV